MNKTGRFSVFFAAAFLVCLLLTGCEPGGIGSKTIPVRLSNQAGRDVTASIATSETVSTDWGDTYDEDQAIVLGYSAAAGSAQEVPVSSRLLHSPLFLYLKDSTGAHWFYTLDAVPTLGEYVQIQLRMDGAQMVVDVDWGDGAFQTLTPVTDSWGQYREFSRWYALDALRYEEIQNESFWYHLPGSNDAKWAHVFGSADADYGYATQEEAAAHMVRITFPVWKLSGNRKVASTASIWIHSALADEVVQIFTEIFNDPEQFPIHSVGGYSWRGNNSSSEHNPGLAIDINPNENYQIRYGNVVVGSFWDPASSPYSIPEDGSVVRIFAAHGWEWGGDAWAGYTTPSTTGNHDYMHFSYFGT